MKVLKERSAGGIVGRDGKILMVRVKNLEGAIIWTFPKGHLEKGENWIQAALREVEEETGWRCQNRGFLARVSYRFRRKEKPVSKVVRWYRLEPMRRSGKPDGDEILSAKWFTPGRAAKLVTYPSDTRVLVRYLKGGRGRDE